MINLIHGDCLKEMRKLEASSFDLILCDPPFGTTACEWDSVIPLPEMWECLERVAKPRAPILLFGQNPFTAALIMSNPKDYRYDWVWQKVTPTGFLNAKKMPLKKLELISVFYKKTPYYSPIMTKLGKAKRSIYYKAVNSAGENYRPSGGVCRRDTGERYPTDILTSIPEDQGSGLHPTQKPVKLLEYFIKTYTKKGAHVLDFTMGSGTTGVACQNTGRDFTGIEKAKKYFNISQIRMDQ